MSSGTEARMFADILRRLDDLESRGAITYDLGSYLPTYVGGTTAGVTTYGTQTGSYIRVGRTMFVLGQVQWTAATGTGEARISLPFAPSAVNSSGSVWNSNVTFANGSPQMLILGTSYFVMDSPLTNAGSTRSNIEAVGNIVFSLTYIVPP
jgi:hypothetical protein